MNYKSLEICYKDLSNSLGDLDKIFILHQKEVFNKGDYIFKQGEAVQSYYILAKGIVRSFINDCRGEEITLDFFTANKIVIDFYSFFQKAKAEENLICITDCECWRLDYNDYQDLFYESSKFREWSLRWFSHQFMLYKDRNTSFFTLTAKERYSHFLESAPVVAQRALKRHIASYLGVSETSFSRIRREIASIK
ncbi:Crp/Fnr family transcriptional regulator [Elizabethkingia anophelis]|uniref:Cyclic nucleotide-binding domain-containing protein n=1 Tax=Elizabethkingia anophelis TaxID=1117645 RepID=A0AAU8UWL9_9FLAO|nr:Crp/Fnr family transcriptional regulator [Elizabethkingia anophelis]AQX02258.1 hypothetical protein BBD32_12720 [Elizabethkingia anophelis]OPB63778.1 hypothetical protein BAY11_16890 [Elizabethkingia anophelis]